MKYELFICQCANIEHQIVISKDEDDILLTIHLIPCRNIWKRIWMAIKYIFGYRCRYGHFDEFIFNDCDIQKLINLLKSNNI